MTSNDIDPLALDSDDFTLASADSNTETLASVSQVEEAMKVLLALADESGLSNDEELIRSLYEQACQLHDESGSPQLSSISQTARQQIGQDVYRQVLGAVLSEEQGQEGQA